MKKPTIRAVFVDFGNVCATFEFRRFIENFGQAVKVPTTEIEAVLLQKRAGEEHWNYTPLFASLECGEIELIGLFHVLMRTLNCVRRIDYFTFADLWADIFLGENKALDKLLDDVSVPKYLLSNTNKLIYERYIAHCKIVQRHFPTHQDRILSFEVGAIKPDPLIYSVALARMRVAPEEALFIDDMGENIDAWRMLGGHGIVYSAQKDSVAVLRKKLRAFGVLK